MQTLTNALAELAAVQDSRMAELDVLSKYYLTPREKKLFTGMKVLYEHNLTQEDLSILIRITQHQISVTLRRISSRLGSIHKLLCTRRSEILAEQAELTRFNAAPPLFADEILGGRFLVSNVKTKPRFKNNLVKFLDANDLVNLRALLILTGKHVRTDFLLPPSRT